MVSAGQLVAGPRGRRLLLAFAQAGEQPGADEVMRLCIAVRALSMRLARERGDAVSGFGRGVPPDISAATPEEVAALLERVPLAPATPVRLREALRASVDAAMYWQEPDADDLVCALPAVRAALVRVAEHLAGSSTVQTWAAPADLTDQWVLAWDAEPPLPLADLEVWRDATIAAEAAARRERPADPRANWSGEWWSHPPQGLIASTGTFADGNPVGLWLVEDSAGWTEATAHRIRAAAPSRVYEIDGAASWAALCREFPLDVTALRRHDWYRTTDRSGPWVLPDWTGIAGRYDAVHLSIAGYLAAATTAIAVDDSASVIAGWNPDTTWWLGGTTHRTGEQVRWHSAADGSAWVSGGEATHPR